jgi:23S rRNA (uracil1939-C5)-methyltransferase
VIEPVLEETRGILLGILRSHQVEPYHELRRTGPLRYVLLRASAEGRVLATLVAARSDWGQVATAVAAALMQQSPALMGVVLNLNPAAGNALLGKAEELLAGQPTLDDQIGDVTVRLGSRSFFQANRAVGSRIYRDLLARLPGSPASPSRLGIAVDAYSGAGGIALSLLPRSSQVIAIEENPAATSAATSLLGASEAARLRLVTADAAQGLAAVEHADLVVVNPPRKGCSPEVLTELRRLSPRWIAYLSCDPGTLARDLDVLAADTTVTSVVPYDMMPHTPHVETLALLSRR